MSSHGPTPRLLLLTGVPGTGKTTLGHYLRGHHGFVHLDFENPATLTQYVDRGLDPNQLRIEELARSGQDVVITWGFLPAEQLNAVLALRAHGFQWFWFDGNREAARRVFLERATVSEQLLDIQMERIATHLDPRMDELAPTILDTFNNEGQHRPLADLANELLSQGA